MMNGSRIVIGTLNNEVRNVMSNIYKNFETPLFFTDRCSAEMIKYASNSFLALKISYINEIANLCECVNANVEDVAIGMSYDDRIGNKFLKPGVGYGGSCFPKDTRAFVNLAYKKGAYLNIINELIKVNDRQNFILLQKAKKYYSTFNKLKIAILGLTFKANTDDLRESPALKNIEILLNSGAEITAYDPKATSNAKKIYPQVKYCFSIEEALINADICFIFTDWDEIRKFDVNNFSNFMKIPIVIDGRNCYDTKLMKGVNIIYESVGRSVIKNTNLE